jgi:hypothetical protein
LRILTNSVEKSEETAARVMGHVWSHRVLKKTVGWIMFRIVIVITLYHIKEGLTNEILAKVLLKCQQKT